MSNPIGTFILDFQSINYDPDSRIAKTVLEALQKACELENAYALDSPMETAGWSFAKLFLSGQFVERLLAGNSYEIERTKGKKFEDKFIRWLLEEFKNKGCGANVKAAPEMREL